MSTFGIIMIVALWAAVICIAIMNAVLFRQIGIMVMGSARGIEDGGIPLGKKLPVHRLQTVTGGSWSPDAWSGERYLVFVGGTYCTECKTLLPMLRDINAAGLKVITFLFGRDELDVQSYVRQHLLPGETVYVTQEIGRQYDVDTVPFVYAVGPDGGVRAKGLAGTAAKLAAFAGAVGVPVAPATTPEARPSSAVSR